MRSFLLLAVILLLGFASAQEDFLSDEDLDYYAAILLDQEEADDNSDQVRIPIRNAIKIVVNS